MTASCLGITSNLGSSHKGMMNDLTGLILVWGGGFEEGQDPDPDDHRTPEIGGEHGEVVGEGV